jgi:2-oxoglutarate ferredoxin oxidoreductase subunit delta
MRPTYERHAQGAAALLVYRDWCKGCNLCIEACPADILSLDDERRVVVNDIEACIFCGLCAERCPDFVFAVERPEPWPIAARREEAA